MGPPGQTPPRRVSYVIPSPTHPIPRLRLPPLGYPKIGLVGPVLLPVHPDRDRDPDTLTPEATPAHPRHRLPVEALALDTRTQLAGSDAPEGLLYTGGRDGQVISWELGLPMARRARRYGGPFGVNASVDADASGRAGVGQWEAMTGWGDDVIDEEEDGEDFVSDGDVLGQVKVRRRSEASRSSVVDGEAEVIPWEDQWELNPDPHAPSKPTQFRQSIQAHTDWVTDLVLCNYNQTVVSASSDGSVKAWNPHTTTSLLASTVGTHSDYVRCLAQSREQKWVASGSFDRTIKLWDLSRALSSPHTPPDPLITLSPTPSSSAAASTDASSLLNANPKASVYALATDPFGRLIASGSPERVVRTWDPRTGKRVGKLVGHTDNIRAILISEDSRYLLTGSSDATIKLWSTAAPQRCLHTFTYHTDSVWALASSHPTLELFYSGDRAGTLCRVDVGGCGDVAEGECVVLLKDDDGSEKSINRVVAMDDTHVWTAGGDSCVRRWNAPPRRSVRISAAAAAAAAQMDNTTGSPGVSVLGYTTLNGARSGTDAGSTFVEGDRSPRTNRDSLDQDESVVSFGSESMYSASAGEHLPSQELDSGTRIGSPQPGIPPRQNSTGAIPAVTGGGMGLVNGLPASALVSLGDPFAPSPFAGLGGGGVRARDPEVATLYSAASVMSVPRAIGRTNNHAPTPRTTLEPPGTATSLYAPTPVPELADPIQIPVDLAADATPLNSSSSPASVIDGEHGLVRSVILNDRMHALTVDTEGEVAVWDIVRGSCLGRYGREEVEGASEGSPSPGSEDGQRSAGALGRSGGGKGMRVERSPREALETVRERVEGEAVVQPWAMADTKIGDLTIHLLDRCFEAEIYADEAGYGPERRFNDELRLNLGKWVLRNLFLPFIREEQRVAPQRISDALQSPPLRGIHRATAPTHIAFDDALTITTRPRTSSTASTTGFTSGLGGTGATPSGLTGIALHSGRTPLTPSLPPDIPQAKLLLSPLIGIAPPTQLETVVEGVSPPPFNDESTPMPGHGHQRAATDTSTATAAPTTPHASGRENDYFSVRGARSSGAPPVPALKTPGEGPAGAGADDDFSGWGGPKGGEGGAGVPVTPMTPGVGSLMGRIRNLGKGGGGGARRPLNDISTPMTPGGVGVAAADAAEKDALLVKSALDELLSHALTPPSHSEAPPLVHASDLDLVISEEVSSNWIPIYRGTVSSTGTDAHILEEKMPLWLLEYLLFNKTPTLALTKLSFALLPLPVKGAGEENDQLPELVNNSTSKLNASRFLRVRKLINHVHERIEKLADPSSRPSSRPASRGPSRVSSSDQLFGSPLSRTTFDLASIMSNRAEDKYEILCNGVVLPLDMTLAAVRQYVWRQGSELVMHYRKKNSTSPTFPVDPRHWRPTGPS